MIIVEPRPMGLCRSLDYYYGYEEAARKANENTNLIDGEKFKKFITKMCKKYGHILSSEIVFSYLDDFMNMTEEELEEFYFT